jgi:hypothetical protein
MEELLRTESTPKSVTSGEEANEAPGASVHDLQPEELLLQPVDEQQGESEPEKTGVDHDPVAPENAVVSLNDARMQLGLHRRGISNPVDENTVFELKVIEFFFCWCVSFIFVADESLFKRIFRFENTACRCPRSEVITRHRRNSCWR